MAGTHPKPKIKTARYSKEQLDQALEAVKKPGITFAIAAARFNVPASTLIKKSKQKNPTITSRGAKTVLPAEIEDK